MTIAVPRGRSFDAWADQYDLKRQPLAAGDAPLAIPYRVDCWLAQRKQTEHRP